MSRKNPKAGEKVESFWCDGELCIEIPGHGIFPYARVIYQLYHNITLGLDDVIVHLDGDKTNMKKENLQKINFKHG